MEQQFSLSWNNFHGNLSKGFAGLLGKGEFVDVTIAVEGHLLQAHKVILSICSPYFKKMFQLNPCQHPIVVLRDVSHKAMTDLLQFMYHGEVSVKREDLTSFIRTAEVLQIKGLTNKETDDEIDSEQELPIQDSRSHSNFKETDTNILENLENSLSGEIAQRPETELIKQKEFLERLHRLSNLKRKSDEFIHNSFYNTDLCSIEKKAKFKDKNVYNTQSVNQVSQGSNYEQIRNIYDERAAEINAAYVNHVTPTLQKSASINKDYEDRSKSDVSSNDIGLDLKSECEDSDNIIVTDPALCSSPKSFDSSKDQQETPLDYPTVQDNCSSLNSLYMDLKNLVNGKVPNMHRHNNQEEFTRMMDHRLVTIPQKEDGKKKYPQRSCRLCWKIGKRRDTRFMCNTCELPFCKNPCFETHLNDVIKASHIHTDYFAN